MEKRVTMERKYLYFPIESKTRELDAKMLLTYYAIKNNYNVILGDHTPIFNHLPLLPKGIILSKGHPHGDSRKKHMANAKKLDYTLVELDEEGLIFGHNYTRLGLNDDYIKILEHVYCWGNLAKENIANNFPAYKDKLHITGHPRFDLLKPKYRDLYSDQVKNIKQKYGDYILVNTRFTVYNHFFYGLNPKQVYIKSLFEQFLKLIHQLSRTFPNLNIIVRPHIHESLIPYINHFKGIKNVFVIHEGSVGQWISASKAVIHNSCTTGIEAFLLDKPVIAYLPLKYNEEKNLLANSVTEKAIEIQQVIDFINTAQLGRNTDDKKNLLSKHYGGMDENYSHPKIINLLNKLNVKGESSIKESTIKALSSLNNGNHTLVTESELKNFFNKMDKIERTNSNIIITPIAKDLIEIKSK